MADYYVMLENRQSYRVRCVVIEARSAREAIVAAQQQSDASWVVFAAKQCGWLSPIILADIIDFGVTP